MSDRNFLNETIAVLAENGKTPADVAWVGNGRRVGSWGDFAILADFTYDAGYGGEFIPSDLLVVGHGWWLERHDYDGSERWEFKAQPATAWEVQPLRRQDVGDGEKHAWSFKYDAPDDEPAPPASGLAPTLAP